MKLPDGWAILTAKDFSDEVYNQTDVVMNELVEMCYAAVEMDELPKKIAHLVCRHEYSFGHSVFTKYYADKIAG